MLAPSIGAKDFDWAKGWEACGSGLCVCEICHTKGLQYLHSEWLKLLPCLGFRSYERHIELQSQTIPTSMEAVSIFLPRFASPPLQHLTSFAAGLVLEHH